MSPRTKGEGGVYQRSSDNRWVGTIEGGYINGKRVRRVVTARTKRELMPKLARLKREMDAGVTGETLTLEAWLTTWHKRGRDPRGKKWAPRTVSGYRTYITQYLIPHLGKKRLTDLRGSDITNLLDWMESEGMSDSTRKQAYSIMRRALEVAYQEQRVLENVAARIPRPSATGNHHQALTVSQARTLLVSCPTSADRARWTLALILGMRQGEVLGLRWEDVHLDHEPHIYVHQQAQWLAGQGMVIKPSTKSSRPRIIPLVGALDPVRQVLREYRTEHGGTGFLFRGDRPIMSRYDWGLWREQLAACGFQPLPLHGARATAEQWLDEAGVGRRTIADILGHQNTTITDSAYHRATMETVSAGLTRALD